MGADRITVSDANDLAVSVAKMAVFINYDIAFAETGTIVLTDTAANLAAVRDVQINAFAATGVTKVDVASDTGMLGNHPLTLSTAKAKAFVDARITFTAGDTITITEEGLNSAFVVTTDPITGAVDNNIFVDLKNAGVDGVSFSADVTLTIRQALGLQAAMVGGFTVTTSSLITIADTQANLTALLTPANIALLGTNASITTDLLAGKIAVTSGTEVVLTKAQALAMDTYGMAIGGDNQTGVVQDTATAIEALVVGDAAKLAGVGVTKCWLHGIRDQGH